VCRRRQRRLRAHQLLVPPGDREAEQLVRQADPDGRPVERGDERRDRRRDQLGSAHLLLDCHALRPTPASSPGRSRRHGGTNTLRGNRRLRPPGRRRPRRTRPRSARSATPATTPTPPPARRQFGLQHQRRQRHDPIPRWGCKPVPLQQLHDGGGEAVRAQDVHGVNALPAAGTKSGRWASTTADARPYAFIRNTKSLSNTSRPGSARRPTPPPACTSPTLRAAPRTETYTPAATTRSPGGPGRRALLAGLAAPRGASTLTSPRSRGSR